MIAAAAEITRAVAASPRPDREAVVAEPVAVALKSLTLR
jgi:hypothetical protein